MSDPVPDHLNAALEGRYEIERELGEGGMATVYLARDLKHNRNVALKVLKPELAAVVGAERFLAEIETTANLQHPHILPLFDSGEAGGFLFYVMPYIEGETLRERLDRVHQLPVDEAVGIATNVAEALDYAHRQGVIHRDVKPANILLQDGKPVVSDFGIALAVSAGGGHRLTETGLSLGTPHYMSPEQATGDLSVGPATDLYALGCVLYEMLLGEPPYTGGSPQAILGRIITGEARRLPDERASVPPHVDAAVRKALEKVPADRFATAGEMARALGDPGFRWGEDTTAQPLSAVRRWRRLAWTASATTVVLASVLVWRLSSLGGAPPDPVRFTSLVLPEGRVAAVQTTQPLAISADGGVVAYRLVGPAGSGELWVRRFSDFEALRVEGGGTSPDARAGSIFLSPDGRWIAFNHPTEREIRRIPSSGGAPESIGPTGLTDDLGFYGGSWGAESQIVIATVRGLRLFTSPGAPPIDLTRTDPEGSVRHRQPSILSDEGGIVFTRSRREDLRVWEHEIAVARPDGAITVVADGHSPRVTDDGILIYATDSAERVALWAARLGDDFSSLVGDPVRVADGVWTASYNQNVAAKYDLAEDGTLVFLPSDLSNTPRLAWSDRRGSLEPVLDVSDPQLPEGVNPVPGLSAARISPDGRRVAFRAVYGEFPTFRIFVYDLNRGVLNPLTVDVNADFPVWTPDGERILFNRFTDEGQDVYWARADNADTPEPFWPPNPFQQHVQDFTPDGLHLIYQEREVAGGADSDILLYSVTPEETALLVGGAALEKHADVSPDGRWLAYASNESGQDRVYVTEFPESRSRITISPGDGFSPVWSPRGDELFYMRDDGTIMSVRVTLGEEFSASTPAALFRGRLHLGYAWGRAFDVHPDGERFLVGDLTGETSGVGRIEVVQNWLDEVRRRLAE